MKILLSTAKRSNASRWICYSCRVKHASTASRSTLPPNTPATQLSEKIGPARTRFAPSPTGYLHLGSLRTALFNYLIAKATGGQFLLRLEDTDQRRTVPDAEERLYQDLKWAGIEWDEGPEIGGHYGPYKQSARTALYRQHAEQLLDSRHAYRCFCSPERLQVFAEHQNKLGLPPDYDRTCAHIPKAQSDDRAAKGEAHVVRLLIPDEYPAFNDIIYGLVHQRKKQRKSPLAPVSFDDPILLKSDGFPTYHLANVVDDHLMKITHVIRGSEWMSSTPKHLAMYQAFGWSPPEYAHVGLLLDKYRQKLSKRDLSTGIADLRDEQGIFPETLTNFVALLGWSHDTGNDVMCLQDLIRNASMKYTRGDTVVTFEKLWFLQKRHAAKYASIAPGNGTNPSHDLRKLAVLPVLKLLATVSSSTPENYSFFFSIPEEKRLEYVEKMVYADAASMNYTTPQNFIERNKFFFTTPTADFMRETVPALRLRKLPAGFDFSGSYVGPTLLVAMQRFNELEGSQWTQATLKELTKEAIRQGTKVTMSLPVKEPLPAVDDREETVEKAKEVEKWIEKSWGRLVHGYVRWAVVGGMPGPEGAETMEILGREECLKRLDMAREVAMGIVDKVKDGAEA